MTDSVETEIGAGESWLGRGNNALMRGITTSGVFVIGITAIGLCFNGQLPFSQFLGAWPGQNLVAMLTIALVVCIIQSYTYAVIGAAVPRSGADYILASRVLNGPAAFISSWVFVITSGLVAGAFVNFIPKVVLPVFLQTIGLVIGTSVVADLSSTLSQTQTQIIIGTVIVLIAFLSLFVTQRTFIKVLTVGLVLALIAWGSILVVFATSGPDMFQSSWDAAMGAGSFEGVTTTAKNLGFTPSADILPMVLAGLAIGLWVFFGNFCSTFYAGEVKKSEQSLLRGNLLALLLTWAILLGAFYLFQRAVPLEWAAAESYLSQNLAYTGTTMPWIQFYASVLAPGIPLAIVILLAWFYSLINMAQVFILYTSRIMLAWADDGLIPANFAYVHPRFRSPLVTMLIVAILVILGMLDSTLGGPFSSTKNFIYFAAATMLVPTLAVTLFPFLKRAWFESCPKFVRWKLGPIPLVTVFGALTFGCLVYILVSPLLVRGGPAPIGTMGLIAFGVILLTGLALYVIQFLRLRSRGEKLDEVFKALPHTS